MKQAAKKMALASMAGAGMLMGASAARASFTVTDTSTIVGTNTVYEFFAQNNGPSSDTGVNLLAINSTIDTSAPMVIDLSQDTDGDGTNDANITGAGIAFGSSTGSFERVGTSTNVSKFFVAGATPANYQTSTSTNPGGALDAAYTSNSVKSLNVQGFSQLLAGGQAGVAASTTPTPFANVVVPTGTLVTVSGTLGGDVGNPQPFTISNSPTTVTSVTSATTPTTPTSTTSGSTPTTAVTNPIVSLTAASAGNPTGFGANVGTLTVTGHNGSYTLGHLVITPTASGFAEAHTFNPTSDPELYGLDVLVGGQQASGADLAILLADVNASGAALGGLVATLTSPSAAFPGADNFFLTAATPPSGDNFLGFNLANATGLSGSATVSEIDVVPEPTSIGLMLGAAALLAGRRRKTA